MADVAVYIATNVWLNVSIYTEKKTFKNLFWGIALGILLATVPKYLWLIIILVFGIVGVASLPNATPEFQTSSHEGYRSPARDNNIRCDDSFD